MTNDGTRRLSSSCSPKTNTNQHTHSCNALEQALWERNRAGHSVAGVVHHSDRGGQSHEYAKGLKDPVGWLSQREITDDSTGAQVAMLVRRKQVNRDDWTGVER